MSRHIPLTGKRFGRLLVLKQVESKTYPSGHTANQWLCKCSCGKEVKVVAQALRTGHTQSCGCFHLEKLKLSGQKRFKVGTAARVIYASYRYGAEKRDLYFRLSFEEFLKIVQLPCAYCGMSGSNRFITERKEEFIYNGIDRVDNSKGYSVENCVACCVWCNRAKRDLSTDEFVLNCSRVAGFYK